MQVMDQDFVHRRIEVTHDQIMMSAPEPRRLDEHRGTANNVRRRGILPAMADDEGLAEGEMPLEARLVEESRARLAARAVILLLVRADENVVERKGGAENFVHPIQVTARKIAARNLRLVCGGDEHEVGGLEPFQCEFRVVVEPEIFQQNG